MSDLVTLLRRRTPAPVESNGDERREPSPAAAGAPEPVFRSAALPRLLEALGPLQAAELVDVGPVIGSNVAFLGERLSVKLYVEDLYADLERHVREEALDRFPEFLASRLTLPAASIDAVLCWDVFDYVDGEAATVLARALTHLLQPGGVLLAFFSAVVRPDTGYTKYVIDDAEHFRCRTYPAVTSRRTSVLQNRDIAKLFEALEVSASVLLKSQLREMLFRKPVAAAARRTEARR